MTFLPSFLLGVLLATPPISPAAAPAPPFTLHISSERAVYAPGDAIKITVLLHVLAPKGIVIEYMLVLDQGGYKYYKLTARGPGGHATPPTAYSRLASHQFWGCSASCGAREVGPGETLIESIMVTRLFDLTAIGNYTIQVTAAWQKLPLTKSNILHITVGPPRPSTLTALPRRPRQPSTVPPSAPPSTPPGLSEVALHRYVPRTTPSRPNRLHSPPRRQTRGQRRRARR